MKTSPQSIEEVTFKPFTDFNRWRLVVTDNGRHNWKYLSEDEAKLHPQTIEDKYWLGLKTVS